jgi:exopolysaccharide biosynthesis WecB/TagA/CpsF family protein
MPGPDTPLDGGAEVPRDLPVRWVAGLPVAAISRRETAELIVSAAMRRPRGERPLFFTSANGEVISRARRDRSLRDLMSGAEALSADGMPMVLASRLGRGRRLPERVATTDLFHDTARLAEERGASVYLFGGHEAVNREACRRVAARYPGLRILGRSHGYIRGSELERRVAKIDALGPDILWVGLGVPREQRFYAEWGSSLPNVGAVKTCGGLFDFLSGRRRRAPRWMQACGLEWLFRLMQEPRRLFWRYAYTNIHAGYLLLTSWRAPEPTDGRKVPTGLGAG